MMDEGQAEEIFWNTPELVERLTMFLDPTSALCLAKAQVMKRKIFRESFSSEVYTSLATQSSFGRSWRCNELNDKQRDDVRTLVEILKLVRPKQLRRFLHHLLDEICRRFPSQDWDEDWDEVEVICPCQEDTHKISLKGFQLLEKEVEGVFGTTVQSLKSVDYSRHPRYLTAVASRMSRQAKVVASVSVHEGLDIEWDLLVPTMMQIATKGEDQRVGFPEALHRITDCLLSLLPHLPSPQRRSLLLSYSTILSKEGGEYALEELCTLINVFRENEEETSLLWTALHSLLTEDKEEKEDMLAWLEASPRSEGRDTAVRILLQREKSSEG